MISNERSWCIPDQLLLRTKTPGRERLEDGAGVGPSIDSQFFQPATFKSFTIWLFNIANWKIPDKWWFIAGKIIYKWTIYTMAMLNNHMVNIYPLVI